MLFVLNAKQDLKKIQMSSWFVYSIMWRKIFEKLPFIFICLVRCVLRDRRRWTYLSQTVSATQNCCRFWKSENFLKLTSKKPSKIKFSNSTISVQLITTSWPGCWWETKGHDRIYKKEKFYAMKVFDSKMNWVVTLTFLKNTIDLKNALHEVYRSYISS